MRRSEWASELEVYGAYFIREAPVFSDGVLNEVWKTQTGETFLVAYVLDDNERFATEDTILRRIGQILSIDPTANS